MYILLDTKDDFHLIDDEDELKRELMNLCFAWTNDSLYCEEMDYNALYNWCLEKHDFGDIAQVFECNKSSLGFSLIEVGETVSLKRIY